ncbi:GntR family transcriptional regulator / MocR family aminotransferase [Pseudonocardia thermophila]|uniref:GntR family transcriptional regulator / MocR family aminotransferase n=1 Tax=Pseudonocardia thermophila TaxID=1848 RepID=A0A1M6WN04_PSETH|nr:PLP-dependent aminotransferase family protein [Pseudonocardia thermophila]SHK95142.1 GntR family transcriptional regulator / MocR family aminotransferase [Pseudonocardia thermophila]
MDLPPLPLDRASDVPLAVQLADAVRAAAVAGTFRRGDRLPSTRALAATLGVSRTVTAAAYEQLLAEGWIEGRRGAGTFVVGVPHGTPAPARAAAHPPAQRGPASAISLEPGSPCREALDPAAWRRAWRAAGDVPPALSHDEAGLLAYRAAVADQLLRHRGLVVEPDEVLATSGTTAAVAELAALLPRGARVAVEDPGYKRVSAALRAAGASVLPVPVDDEGLDVAALPAQLDAVYCTPAHQYPLGARLSASRRLALVERARAEGFLVIEDDYDGELRYDVAPLPLLAALAPDVVAHLGTTSKVLTPTLGVGWIVAPPEIRAALLAARGAGARPAEAGQRVFAAFAAHGDLARHLRRLRRILGERRAETVAAIRTTGNPVRGDAAGGHVVVPLADAAREAVVVSALAARDVSAAALSPYHAPGRAAGHGIVVGYAGPDRADLRRALGALRDVLAEEG